MRRLLPFLWSGALAALLTNVSLAAPFAFPALGQAADEQGPAAAPNPRNAIRAEADRSLMRLESPRFT